MLTCHRENGTHTIDIARQACLVLDYVTSHFNTSHANINTFCLAIRS